MSTIALAPHALTLTAPQARTFWDYRPAGLDAAPGTDRFTNEHHPKAPVKQDKSKVGVSHLIFACGVGLLFILLKMITGRTGESFKGIGRSSWDQIEKFWTGGELDKLVSGKELQRIMDKLCKH